ncbi:MAG TPA: methyltransferase domain-containing protein [Terracidiphilus sp.]|nr:methyltransferase domain-containing protein [Terracidiphilus sp.]
METPEVKQCCAAFYGSDLAKMLLGESFHPGGARLTERLGQLLQLDERSHVLEVACGRGTSALHLAERFGCSVLGIDLSAENIAVAAEEADRRGLNESVQFQRGDAELIPVEDTSFDAIVCECAFCTFPGKPVAALEFHRVLRPGGRVGLSDLTRTPAPIPELEGLLAWVACIADALPAEQYAAVLQEANFLVESVEDHSEALVEMVRQVQGRLLGAEVLAGLEQLSLPGVDFEAARKFAEAALRATRGGALGYLVLIARKA